MTRLTVGLDEFRPKKLSKEPTLTFFPGAPPLALVVQKFGGSSVATAERIMAAARRAVRTKLAGHNVIVVVSARGDTTDELIALAQEISENPPSREMDMLLATGEQISIALLAMAIHSLGHKAVSFTGMQVGIVTDNVHTKARIKSIDTTRLRKALNQGNIAIVAGFQGIDEQLNITTLGRGGSDTTAVALAAVMKHDPLGPRPDVDTEIYTDVDGIYTTDPRIVPEARKIPYISYEEMLELASLGAGVMHSRSIEFAKKFAVPLQVRSSFSDVEGTWIVPEAPWMQQAPVCGAALARDEARVRLSGVPDQLGLVHRIFSAVAAAHVVVDMIAAGLDGNGHAEIGFTVLKNDLPQALRALEPVTKELGGRLSYYDGVSKVSAVGIGMKTHSGVAEAMFQALAAESINLQMISTSEIKISVLVAKEEGQRALRAVHQAFSLDSLQFPEEARQMQVTAAARQFDPSRDLSPLLASMEEIVVSEVVLDDTQSRLTVLGLPDRPGVVAQLFSPLSLAGIVVDMIVLNIDDQGYTELSLTVPRSDLARAQEQIQLAAQRIHPQGRVVVEPDIAKVIVDGVGMRTHTGVARKMFGALAAHGINIIMISTSECRVGVVVDLKQGKAALHALRQAFGIN
jgi:aspartate kinase